MSAPFSPDSFGAGTPFEAFSRMFEQMRGALGSASSGSRKPRGDVRAAVLVLLAEEPMHGYQIIREIELRSGGTWKPSAGSVYPTLQLFADEGLVQVEESQGRKTYALTDAGREEAARANVPWSSEEDRQGHHLPALPKAALDLAHATSQVAHTGTAEQTERAVEVLADARRRIYAILAEG